MITSLRKEEAIALLALVSILSYVLMAFFIAPLTPYANYPLYFTLVVGGGFLVFDLLKQLINFDFGSDLLAGISIITAFILGEYLAGALVVLMLSGGQTIENYAVRKASKMLDLLAKRAPTIAHRKQVSDMQDIAIDEIKIGDTLIVFPHEICPVDGVVLEGQGVMDEAYLTGEPFLIAKAPGAEVLSGSINSENSLTIKATQLAQDSRYAKIMKVTSESEQKRPQMRRLADQLGAWYTPIALIIALLAWYFSGEAVRFLAVLVIATPCPLLIAIPVAIIGSISLCALRGILIKDPTVLEQVDLCRTMIFDKTGTLTYGKPTLTDQTMMGPYDAKTVLGLVASLERYSKHPLSSAILAKATEENIVLSEAAQVNEPKGKGMQGIVNDRKMEITSRKKLTQEQQATLPEGKGLECIVLMDGQLAAHYRFRDAPRSDSRSFIQHLAPMHHIRKTMIISGDRVEEVRYLAEAVGIKEIYGSKSPEEKVALVQKETRENKTAYLGDGINDAPALLAATVGIAFGRNSDITAEAAGAVIMEDTLEKVDEFLHISRRMRKVALQSALGGMFLSILGMLIAAFGYLPPVAGAISQEVIDVLAILNSLRTIWPPKTLTDIT